MKKNWNTLLSKVTFTSAGLVPAIVQDHRTKQVLMVAYMNRRALRMTLDTRIATYWSRSRKEIWIKGKTSGHYQHVKEVLVDCDMDAILILVKQDVAACHEGYRSCFFRAVRGTKLAVVGKKIVP